MAKRNVTTRELFYLIAERHGEACSILHENGSVTVGTGQLVKHENAFRDLHRQLSKLPESDLTFKAQKNSNEKAAEIKAHFQNRENLIKALEKFIDSSTTLGDIQLPEVIKFRDSVMLNRRHKSIAENAINNRLARASSPIMQVYEKLKPKRIKSGYLIAMQSTTLQVFQELNLKKLKPYQESHLLVMLRECPRTPGKKSKK